MNNEVNYRSLKAVNASLLKECAKSEFHGYQYLTKPRENTKATTFGTLVHKLLLEPHASLDNYLVIPKGALTKKYEAEANGREIIREPLFKSAIAIRDAAKKSKAISGLLEKSSKEVELYFDVNGTPCKARVDGISSDGTLFDIKTTRYKSAKDFFKFAMRSDGIDIQMSFYKSALEMSGYKVKEVVLLVIPKDDESLTEPDFIIPIRLGPNVLEEGDKKINETLNIAAKLIAGYEPKQPQEFINMDYFEIY
jgi:hypothetical protein